MFNRNPYMTETSDILHEADGNDTSMFAKILGAIKEADKIMENKTTSAGQVILFNRKLYNLKIHEVILKISPCTHIHMDAHIHMLYKPSLFLLNSACFDYIV